MAAATPTPTYAFGGADYDWARYERVRPKYPPALREQILEYHRSHGGAFDQAHDVGSGLGIVADKYLIPNFQHVVVSDPTATNINVIRSRLGHFEQEGKVSVHQAPGETRFLPDGSIDLVTAFECLHWSDCNKSMPNIAAQLKPGGTFALLYYTPQPLLPENERAQKAFSGLVDKWSEQALENNPFVDLYPKFFHGADSHIELSTDHFEPGAKRIAINTSLLTRSAHTHPDTPFQVGKYHPSEGAPWLVGKHDQCESVVDVTNWSEDVTWTWLDELISTLQPPVDRQATQGELKELEAAFQEADGRIKIVWILQLILATKK